MRTAGSQAGGFVDVAVRDVVISVAAFTLARLLELRAQAPAASLLAAARPRQATS